ncbi:hypothetical protein LJC73_04845 [Bacteroidales bacterium OttesenSCG-928-L14]|nr:hypothetical protein [Bacteroidales bacterium OttesenSCG-928-L14]
MIFSARTKYIIVAIIGMFISCSAYSIERNPKNNFKTTFLSFYTGSAKLTYERALFNKQSIEITAGYIGVGYDSFNVQPKGALFRLAYKFIFSPNQNVLTGFYLKPEFAYSEFGYNCVDKNLAYAKYSTGNSNTRGRSCMGTLMACAGYQMAKNILVFDAFVGAGFGIGNDAEIQYHHGFIERYKHLTLTFGVKVGIGF